VILCLSIVKKNTTAPPLATMDGNNIGIHSAIWLGGLLGLIAISDFILVAIPWGFLSLGSTIPRIVCLVFSVLIFLCAVSGGSLCFVARFMYSRALSKQVQPSPKTELLHTIGSWIFIFAFGLVVFLWFFAQTFLFSSTVPAVHITVTYYGDLAYCAWLIGIGVIHFVGHRMFELWSPQNKVPDGQTTAYMSANEQAMRTQFANTSKVQFAIWLVSLLSVLLTLIFFIPFFWSQYNWWWVQLAVTVPMLTVEIVVVFECFGTSNDPDHFITSQRYNTYPVQPGVYNARTYEGIKKKAREWTSYIFIPGANVAVVQIAFIWIRFILFFWCIGKPSTHGACVYGSLIGDFGMVLFNAVVVAFFIVVLYTEKMAYAQNQMMYVYARSNTRPTPTPEEPRMTQAQTQFYGSVNAMFEQGSAIRQRRRGGSRRE
jgi:hypothetical protein